MSLIYFVRHGQTDWNAAHRLQGQSDIDLNETGRSQAALNGRRLSGLVADPASFDFVASPMRRARETMEIVRRTMGLDPDAYRTDPRLVEINFGDWQGYTYPELEQRYPDFARTRDADKWNILPPGVGAESYAMLTDRVRPWLQSVDQPTVCVAHGGVARALLTLATGMSGADAAHLEIPQDRVLRIEGREAEWI